YKETLLPLVQKCMDAITGVSPREVSSATQSLSGDSCRFFSGGYRLPPIKIESTVGKCDLASQRVAIVKSFSRSFDSWEGLVYPTGTSLHCSVNAHELLFVVVQLLDGNNEVLARKSIVGWQPFSQINGSTVLVGPYFDNNQGFGWFVFPALVAPSIELDLNLLKEIKTIEIGMEVVDFTLTL
ncbi:MAG: hypothetical protein ACKOEZ_04530, partial [Spartobacteria bacterium]